MIAVLWMSGSLACMGHNGLTGKLRNFNLELTQNRWGREITYFVLFPVYTYITGPLDNLIFNSIEFWSGTNPLSGQSPPVVDMDASMLEGLNVEDVSFAQLRYRGSSAALHVVYRDGRDQTLIGVVDGERLRFFRGPELFLELKRGVTSSSDPGEADRREADRREG